MSAVETLADLWVELAAGQREHGTHLRAAANRQQVRESISRHVVTDRIRVAQLEDRLVGFVMFSVESDALERYVTRGLVENLFVVPEYRERGIGTQLLEAAETRLCEEGVDVVAIDVMADNDAAREFYRSNGYEPHRVTVEKSIESDTHSKDQG